jgi:hypothetical protein
MPCIFVENGYEFPQAGLLFKPMIRLATETDPTFAPYSNICPITAYTEGEIEVSDGDGNVTTHTTTFPSAIYRGSEDAVNGEVTSEWGVVDLGSLEWSLGVTFYAPLPLARIAPLSVLRGICTCYGWSTNVGATANIDDKSFVLGDTYAYIYIKDTSYTSAADFKSAVTGQTLAYELSTPTIETITPTNLPIKSLFGYNHIESSTGDMEIEYIAKAFSHITEIVDSQISALQKMMELMLTANREEEMKATRNYTAGDLLIVSGKLYKASSNIANGSTLVINSNVTSTTIAAELAALA